MVQVLPKYEKDIIGSSLVKGNARIAARLFISGRTTATKYRVCLATTKDVRVRFYF